MNGAHRSEIDGLRALAVLAVIGFHTFPHQVRGGFVGVDIFFVISGFLISGIIFSGMRSGEFTLSGFYVRRIKRIFPALSIVLFGCLVAGWLLLLPAAYGHVGRDVAGGAAFIANFEQLQGADYFHRPAQSSPLLNLWSLGVEEQFYLIWPVLLLLGLRWSRGPLVLACVLLVGSFLSSIMLGASNPSAAFYLPVTRFWELMLGCVLALTNSVQPSAALASAGALRGCYRQHREIVHEAAGWIGLALLITAVVWTAPERYYPGWQALAPAAGALLLLFAGSRANANRRVLAHPALVYIGLISYPLYLWHWPILAFLHEVRLRPPTSLIKLAAICIAVLLGDLTYRLIEKPIRFGAPSRSKPATATLMLTTSGVLGMLIYAGSGIPGRFPPDAQLLLRDFETETPRAYRSGKCLLGETQGPAAFRPECEAPGDRGPKVLLWGDSHAAHVYPGLELLASGEHSLQLTQYTASACPPVLGFESVERPRCAEVNQFVREWIELSKPDTVILGGRWALYDGTEGWGEVNESMLRRTVQFLVSVGVRRVVAMGQFPLWRVRPPRIVMNSYRGQKIGLLAQATAPIRNRELVDPATFKTDAQMRHIFATTVAHFISPPSSLCDDEGCLFVVPGTNQPFAWDDSHMTEAGSSFFVRVNATDLAPELAEPPRASANAN